MPDMAPHHHLDFILNPAPSSSPAPTMMMAPSAPPAPLPSLFAALPSARYAAPPTIDVVPSSLRRKRELPVSFPAPHDAFCGSFADAKRQRAACSPVPVLPSLFPRSFGSPNSLPAPQAFGYPVQHQHLTHSPTPSVTDSACMATSSEGEVSADDEEHEHEHEGGAFAIGSAAHSKKKTRLCKVKGCTSLAVSRRSCVRHGGGSRCVVEGCTNGAKLRNRCFQHGGSTVCLAAGCNSKAKRYGYCWSHGGGRICSADGCAKVAAQGGLCWAHGGGNRCKLEGCSKRSYQKHGYYCKAHAAYNVPAAE